MSYFHGGIPGLGFGDRLAPPDETGNASSRSFADAAGIKGAEVIRTDRVYVTTSPQAAYLFAGLYPGGGDVYEVLIEGDVEPDPDCSQPGLSWECQAARVVGVLARGVQHTPEQVAAIAGARA